MSLLKQGNTAFQNKDYQKALDLYEKAVKNTPTLKDIIQFNVDMVGKKTRDIPLLPILTPIKKLPITVLVITWDVGHNPLGRSYMLAEALERSVRNVVIAGFQFPRYGDDIWQPVRNGRLPVISLAGGDMSEWLSSCEKAVDKFKPDVVIACKPRLPSVEMGILFKEKYNIPLIIDVDDHELSFFKSAPPLKINDIKAMESSELSKDTEPYAEIWTRLTDSLTKDYADEIITSNVALDKEFGGTIIPHVRDEMTFDPTKYNKAEQRRKYGISEDLKIVMFFGTPRIHKGVGDIAKAIGKISDPKVQLVIVGEAPDKSVTSQIESLSNNKSIYLPNQPFSAIPEIIVMADLILLPQDVNHPISKHQLPAKAIDAIGMGIPLFVSSTEPLMQLVNDGVASPLSNEPLELIIERELAKVQSNTEKLKVRKKFLLNYSYHSAAVKLKGIIEKAQKNNRKSLDGFSELREVQKVLFPVKVEKERLQGVDVVIFWKQNDTGLYGRRSDMVIKYLANREDVRKVIVFDAPLSQFDIENMKGNEALNQKRNIYIKTYEKLLGKLDNSKVSFNVFLHPSGIYTNKKEGEKGRVPLLEGYKEYINEVLDKEDVKPKESIFWFYPKISLAEEIIDIYKPKKIIVDVVDDHRAWPNVTEKAKKELTDHYRNLLGKADVAFANCQPVIDSMKAFKPDIRLVPNGCEENPEFLEPKNHAMYEEMKAFKGKVIGFVGNLEAKIDIRLIEKVAESFQRSLIVLVGSTHANPDVVKLKKHSNIKMFGVVPYENVNAVVQRFDVGIVPHKNIDMTKNMNPLKVFVYASNGIPVVSTKVFNVKETDGIFISIDDEDFINNVKSSLEMKGLNYDSYILKNSWSSRFYGLEL